MITFELDRQGAQLQHVNPRSEVRGKDRVACADLKIAFTTENAATQIAFEGGQYAARVVIPSLGSGLDAYTSPEGSVQAAAGSISVRARCPTNSSGSRRRSR